GFEQVVSISLPNSRFSVLNPFGDTYGTNPLRKDLERRALRRQKRLCLETRCWSRRAARSEARRTNTRSWLWNRSPDESDCRCRSYGHWGRQVQINDRGGAEAVSRAPI